MKKTKNISLLIISIVIVVIISVILVPIVVRQKYIKDNSDENLLLLCKVACLYNNKDIILEYVPLLASDMENIDEYMARLLEKSIECEYDVFVSNVKKAYLSFSSVENAVGQCSNAINQWYEAEKNREHAKEVYDTLFDVSPNPEYRYLIFQQESSFFAFTLNDIQYGVKTREKRDELWDEYEAWAENN